VLGEETIWRVPTAVRRVRGPRGCGAATSATCARSSSEGHSRRLRVDKEEEEDEEEEEEEEEEESVSARYSMQLRDSGRCRARASASIFHMISSNRLEKNRIRHPRKCMYLFGRRKTTDRRGAGDACHVAPAGVADSRDGGS